jgi:hypothetical protein
VSFKIAQRCVVCVCLIMLTVTALSLGSPQHLKSSTTAPSTCGVTFAAVNGAGPNGYASVTVKATPNAESSIRYVTPHGSVSRAKGLEDQTTDSDGQTTWTWKIGARTESGAGSVTVTCNGDSATASIEIGQ